MSRSVVLACAVALPACEEEARPRGSLAEQQREGKTAGFPMTSGCRSWNAFDLSSVTPLTGSAARFDRVGRATMKHLADPTMAGAFGGGGLLGSAVTRAGSHQLVAVAAIPAVRAPLWCLVDRQTSGAAELLAAGLRAYAEATVASVNPRTEGSFLREHVRVDGVLLDIYTGKVVYPPAWAVDPYAGSIAPNLRLVADHGDDASVIRTLHAAIAEARR